MALVAIVGRPNVGKSTLFNRLVGMRQAIVDETAGVTRDRHYGKCEWCGREFSVVDTGGYTSNSDDVFEDAIRRQVGIAIEEADVVLFMCEAATGITDYDAEIADLLRRSKKPVVLCVNKVDTGEKMYDAFDFYGLGLGEVWTISAANGSGTGDLLDEIVKALPEEDGAEEDHADLPHIAIVGRPNVGKSSLTNALLGEERNIVTPVAGTTRDSISTYYNKFGHEFMIVDTAGMRKRGKVTEDLEFYSVLRAMRTIEHSDVCILMIDATLGMEAQDMNIFNVIQKNRKGCVIVVSHDRDFLQGLTDSLFEFRDGAVHEFKGDIFEFLEYRRLEHLKDLEKTKKQTAGKAQQEVSQSKLSYQQSKERERELRKLRGNVERIEQEISQLEEQIAEKESLLAAGSAEATNNPDFYAEYQRLKDSLEERMSAWEEATIALEEFNS